MKLSADMASSPSIDAANDCFSELGNVNMQLEPDTLLQGLSDFRSELTIRVQDLKQDLREWKGKLDAEVNSYNEEIGDLKNSLNSEVEQLKSEFQELRDTLKGQLAAATSKLAELDTSVGDCTQHLEGLSTHCRLEKELFDDLIADTGIQGFDKEEPASV